MKTDLELISNELSYLRPTSVRLVETRKYTDGEHRFYEVCATLGDVQADMGLCIADWSDGPTTVSRIGCDYRPIGDLDPVETYRPPTDND